MRAAKQIQRGSTDTVANLKQRAVVDRAAAAVERAAVDSDDAVGQVGGVQPIDRDGAAVERQRAVAHIKQAVDGRVGDDHVAAVDENRVTERRSLHADGQSRGGDRSPAGDSQLVADAGVADVKRETIVPKRAGSANQHNVVAAGGMAAKHAEAVADHATVQDCKLVERAVVANVEIVGIIPDGASAADPHGVVAAGAVTADVAEAVVDRATVQDRKLVGGTDAVTEAKRAAVVP